MAARRIAVLTTGRQDLGVLQTTIQEMITDDGFEPRIWAGGMHMSRRFGKPLAAFTPSAIPVHRRLEFIAEPPEPASDTARALAAVAEALDAERPCALMLVGDRAETVAAAAACTIKRVPIVHLHGGEETVGAIDNVFRHAITKMSHLHLVAHEHAARRVLQMGEDPHTVHVVGAPGVDHLYREDLPPRAAVAAELGRPLPDPLVLVTVHPTTLGGAPLEEITAVTGAIAEVAATFVVTLPNADEGGAAIRDYLERWARGRMNVILVEALGADRYWALLREAAAVLGNSSSGILEAPFAGVPVVNVGDRQAGRFRLGAVYDVNADPAAIVAAMRDALRGKTPSRPGAAGFPTGPAAPRVLRALRAWEIPVPPRKIFFTPGRGESGGYEDPVA